MPALYNVIEQGEHFAVVEQATGYSLVTMPTRKEATKVKKFMASGGAFNGFTPQFVAKPVDKGLCSSD